MNEKKAYYYYEKGKEKYISKDYVKARQFFEEFLKFNDNFADVHNYLGYIYYASNDLNRAIEHYKKAIELNPYYTEALINLVVILHSIGEFKKAEKYLDSLKKSEKVRGIADKYCIGKLANMHAEIANRYTSLFLYEEAANEYEKALRLAPDFPDIRLEYANVLRDLGRLEEAIVQYDEILIRKPHYVEALINMAIAYYKLGYLGFCINALKKAKEINPENRMLKAFLYLLENAKEVE
ncbi:tetratricopeptide repeat protein [Deferribacter autotrophicus]|uniref:Tetratricopeptide repeat protein n=1 Tax=Deferribacter autotrophicus TaxID=500465 RepID=A0A5A8F5H8_9BACT|nr:tetratricopeptide repeat protein [Deferribacter autotrophicus]KAA0258644.1 tetratricopeptide repeat protein [Deferribacter autotrophicus]